MTETPAAAWPANTAHARRLWAFAAEVLDECAALGVRPVVSSSLAVFARTEDPSMPVNDVDLGVAQTEFVRLAAHFDALGIECRSRPWHVLQLHRDGLKVEFDAVEHWLTGVDLGTDRIELHGLRLDVLRTPALRELYQRGADATAPEGPSADPDKHTGIVAQLARLALLT